MAQSTRDKIKRIRKTKYWMVKLCVGYFIYIKKLTIIFNEDSESVYILLGMLAKIWNPDLKIYNIPSSCVTFESILFPPQR